MDENEAIAKFQDILQIIKMWANEDLDKGTVMSADEFENTVIENDYNNPMVTIWEYYQYLTGAGDEW
jgi:hypothetical protein